MDVAKPCRTANRLIPTVKIAQVAPLHESVPPAYYGGTERVVSYLTEELVQQGHEVTLFASGDSQTTAELVPVCERALRLDTRCADPLAHHMLLLDLVFADAHRFDIVHFHIDYLHFPSSRLLGLPQITTLHGRLDLPDLVPLYRAFADMPVVSISSAQRAPLPWLDWRGTVHHGLPLGLLRPWRGRGGYLAFLGRISPEKGVDEAIEIARRTGMELRIAAKVDRVDQRYFDTVIRQRLETPGVTFVGEIDEPRKQAFLGDAAALLVPIDWPEPFGLVMIEALACGTPVVAFARGSVPEVVDDGRTGFVCDGTEEAVLALRHLPSIDRRQCRAAFDARFQATRMAADYVRIYQDLLQDAPRHGRRDHPGRRPVLHPRRIATG